MTNKTSAILFISILRFALVANACVPCKTIKPPPAVLAPKAQPAYPYCPRDTLKLGACATVLDGVVNLVSGSSVKSKCCAVLQGLADLEEAVCLCTAIKANVLGINLNVPLSLSWVLNSCGKKVPRGFVCA